MTHAASPSASPSRTKKPLVRFAPSPTGHLHVGNIRTALINYLFAARHGGEFMLRFDDTDTARNKSEFYQSIRRDLNWMGIVWDAAHEIRQSTRTDNYTAALGQLIDQGRVYRCFETADELALMRKTQLAQSQPPRYNRAARNLSPSDIKARLAKGETPYYRFLLDEGEVVWDDLVRGRQRVNMASLSDPVVRRADGRFIYTLASVVDDVEFATTHILRGEDHTTNSAAQLQIFKALGHKPPALGHFPLLLGKGGEGLSKRLGSLTVAGLRETGIEAETIASLLVRLGTGDKVAVADSVADLAHGFDVAGFGRAPPRFDEAVLPSLNMQRLARMDFGTAQARLAEVAGGEAVTAEVWEAVKSNCAMLKQAVEWQQRLTMPLTMPLNVEAVDADWLAVAAKRLPEGDLTGDAWRVWSEAVVADTGLAKKQVYQTLRLALTGETRGPEMAKLLPILGRGRILRRLQNADSKHALIKEVVA